ncbi:hypothetical protein [Kitasatospora sp. NPDC059327]|uniref:hypothetical protein n=1 Tax=Kitasatospora sp. NPDC059327 TaxID=3346803 RepID=UPI0036B369CA
MVLVRRAAEHQHHRHREEIIVRVIHAVAKEVMALNEQNTQMDKLLAGRFREHDLATGSAVGEAADAGRLADAREYTAHLRESRRPPAAGSSRPSARWLSPRDTQQAHRVRDQCASPLDEQGTPRRDRGARAHRGDVLRPGEPAQLRRRQRPVQVAGAKM